MTMIESARSSAWALGRAILAWLHTFGRHRGRPGAFRSCLRAWWRLRALRRQITSVERQLGLSERWRP